MSWMTENFRLIVTQCFLPLQGFLYDLDKVSSSSFIPFSPLNVDEKEMKFFGRLKKQIMKTAESE